MPSNKNRNHANAYDGKSMQHQDEGKRHKIISRDGKFNYDSGRVAIEREMASGSDYVNSREINKKVRYRTDN